MPKRGRKIVSKDEVDDSSSASDDSASDEVSGVDDICGNDLFDS